MRFDISRGEVRVLQEYEGGMIELSVLGHPSGIWERMRIAEADLPSLCANLEEMRRELDRRREQKRQDELDRRLKR